MYCLRYHSSFDNIHLSTNGIAFSHLILSSQLYLHDTTCHSFHLCPNLIVFIQFLIGRLHKSFTSSQVIEEIDFSTCCIIYDLCGRLTSILELLVSRLLLSNISLQFHEKLLYWIQPWRVLCIEKHYYLELFTSFQDYLMVMNSCVIHEQYHKSIIVLRVTSHIMQGIVNEVLKEACINCSFYNLIRNYFVVSNGRD